MSDHHTTERTLTVWRATSSESYEPPARGSLSDDRMIHDSANSYAPKWYDVGQNAKVTSLLVVHVFMKKRQLMGFRRFTHRSRYLLI